MVLSDLSVKRPVLATVISLLITVLGLTALLQLPIREYPDIDPPIVSVITEYTGASAQIMDTEVGEIIEGAISRVEGISSIVTSSREGRSETTVEFNLERNVDNAANDVRDALGRIQADLPLEADPPIVRKADANARPMMWIALSSNRLAPPELTDLAERVLVDRLSILEGVADVRIGGERRYAMRVWLDRQALASRNLTVADVENALRRSNVELPGGRLESLTREFSVRTDTRLSRPEEFRNLTIRRDGDYQIRLGEVARVERGVENDDSVLRANGRTSVGLGIVRQSQANTMAVAEAVQDELEALNQTLPEGVSLTVSYNEALFIEESIREVMVSLAIAVALVVLIILIFLRSLRATLIPAVTIPVAVIGAFTVMNAMGFSINVLTLLALILAIGLVVDDAIVMLENIQRRIDEGEPRLLAAYRGSGQVAFAIVATTLTLIAVFVPISFMQGNVGRLFSEFGFVMAAAVAFSSLVALTLTPMLCSKWLSAPDPQPSWIIRASDRVFDGMAALYRTTLQVALKLPVVVLGLAGFVAAAAYLLFLQLPQELTPIEDRGVFIIPASAPEGSTVENTFQTVLELEEIIQPLVENGEVRRVFSIIGWGGDVSRSFTIVGLVDWGERQRRQQEIVASVFPQILNLPGARAFAVNPPGLGQSGFDQPIRFVIGAPDYDSLAEWKDLFLEAAGENPNLLNLDADFEQTRPQLLVDVDRQRASDLGVSVEQIGTTLQTMIASRAVTTYIDRGREYDVVLQAKDQDRTDPHDLTNIFVRAESGNLIPLSSLISTRETGTSPVLKRVDRMPSMEVTASLAPGYDLGAALTYLDQVARDVLPLEARVSYLGQSEEFRSTSGAIYVTFALALVIVFLVLAAQFESFIHPFIIILSVPLAVTGALGTLLFSGNTLNIYSQIGMILLIGLMTKNGILIVEFANQLRDEGRSVREAILEGSAIRFRPVLMTAVSTVFGALPLVVSSGAGAESRSAIGLVIVGGMSFATVLTLYVIPVVYDLLAPFTRSANYVTSQIEALSDREGQGDQRNDLEAQPGE